MCLRVPSHHWVCLTCVRVEKFVGNRLRWATASLGILRKGIAARTGQGRDGRRAGAFLKRVMKVRPTGVQKLLSLSRKPPSSRNAECCSSSSFSGRKKVRNIITADMHLYTYLGINMSRSETRRTRTLHEQSSVIRHTRVPFYFDANLAVGESRSKSHQLPCGKYCPCTCTTHAWWNA